MIDSLEFSRETIVAQEQQGLSSFYDNDDSELRRWIIYYEVLFRGFLAQNGDKNFIQLKDEEQEAVIEKTVERFRNGMQYAFNKGHQATYGLLLTSGTQTFSKDSFSNPASRDYFLFNFDNLFAKDVFEDNLRRNALDILIKYTRRYFENGYQEIMDLANRFFKKGAEVAFDQIRVNILHVNYSISGHSRLLNVPLNQSFAVTPAFQATFSLESPAYEEWNLHWNATYGFDAAKSLVAKTMIHQFTVPEIQSYASFNAETYQVMQRFFNLEIANDDPVYMVRTDFLLTDASFPREIEENEYLTIRVSLKDTICRRLNVDGNHIFMAD